MKGLLFVFLAGTTLLCAGTLRAQTADTNAAPTAPTLSDAQIAEYQKRFEQGYDLEKQGDLAGARAIYDGILAEQPDAKRSLLESGRISLLLDEPDKADAYLDKLHTIVPDFPEAIELLIQASEALHHEVKADRLVREYRALRNSGTVPGLADSLLFTRERIHLSADSEIVISQFFDYTKPPCNAFMAELSDSGHQTQRKIYLNYDPVGTQAVRAKDPKLARDEVFLLAEPFATGRIDVYQELLSMPDYDKVRTMLLLILTQTPKPIYSSPANPSAQ
jgi:tetratricopeptide (TPR) repeat protein